jgi:manganese transport protein
MTEKLTEKNNLELTDISGVGSGNYRIASDVELDSSLEDPTIDLSVKPLISPWIREVGDSSLPEFIPESVESGDNVPWYRTLKSYCGPGALVAVGYMDPGNWSTDIAGGSAFGYTLLFIILLSSLMAMFLQRLAAKLGLATRRDLAQACRDAYPDYMRIPLWLISEVAIMATDVAEVIGSAIALKLLFGLPVIAGVLITACDIFVLLLVGTKMRYLEMIIGSLVLLITVCFAIQVGFSNPSAEPLLVGFLPSE